MLGDVVGLAGVAKRADRSVGMSGGDGVATRRGGRGFPAIVGGTIEAGCDTRRWSEELAGCGSIV